MRAQIRLLEYILKTWNPEQQHFEVGAHILTMEVEYIYFLTGISRIGVPISLTCPHGGDVTTQVLIDQYCFPRTQMSGKNIPIKYVWDLPLRTVLFTMQRVSRSHVAHKASRAHMLYVLESMELAVLKWDEALLVTFKEQLTMCHHGELNQFGLYGTILVSFFLE